MKQLKKHFNELNELIAASLNEDIGSGDVTTDATIPPDLKGTAKILAKENGVLCGVPLVQRVFKILDPAVKINFLKTDGDILHPGDIVAEVYGRYRSLLIGERLALNFIQRLSGIATAAKKFADILEPYGSKMYDTRKTTPLWRAIEKYAVRTGGGCNHRFGLYDMFLIKDNHVDVAGGVTQAIELAMNHNPRKLKIACETRNMDEVKEAVAEKIDLILLDNMNPAQVKKALALIGEGIEVEISGGITLANVEKYAKVGVKRFSTGSLTHSVKSLDLSMKIFKK